MVDRRVIRTKETLRTALLDLCRTRPLSAVSVKDLLDQAQLSRSAFYRHYRDIDDLAQDVWLSRMPYFTPPYPRLADYASPGEACRVLLGVLADELLFFKENTNFAKGIVDNIGRSPYYRDSEALHMELLGTQMVTEYGKDASYMGLRPEDSARYIISGQFALIRQWIIEGMTRDIEETCKMIAFIDFQCTAAVAGRPIEPYFLEVIREWHLEGQAQPATKPAY